MAMPSNPARTLTTVRRMLLGSLVLGIPGTAAELLLLGHFDGWKQLIPLALLGIALLVLVWHAANRGPAPVLVLQLVLLLFLASGGLGVLFHYRGNVEFELEMYPSTAGFQLFKKAMTGATPALAPGTMVLLGLVGLAYTIGHPRVISQEEPDRDLATPPGPSN
jgi:hypothetical protein